MRWSTKLTRYWMGGVGKLSSLGKINASFFFIRPSFFIRLASWLEILDLSHSAAPRSCAAMLASGVLCLVSLDRGGINNGAGESRGVVERRSFWLQWSFCRGDLSAAQRRDCWRKKKTLYSKPTNRRTVGCRRNGSDDLHVSPWVIKSFYCDGTGQALQCACQKKRRTCVPHLRNVSQTAGFWTHKSGTGQGSRSPDTAVVAIVSTDVTLKERNFDCVVLKIGDRDGLMITS